MLHSRGHGRHPNALIPGFVPSSSSNAAGVVQLQYYPVPEVPPGFSGKHVFAPAQLQAQGQQAAAPGRAGAAVAASGAASGGSAGASICIYICVGASPAVVSCRPPPPPPRRLRWLRSLRLLSSWGNEQAEAEAACLHGTVKRRPAAQTRPLAPLLRLPLPVRPCIGAMSASPPFTHAHTHVRRRPCSLGCNRCHLQVVMRRRPRATPCCGARPTRLRPWWPRAARPWSSLRASRRRVRQQRPRPPPPGSSVRAAAAAEGKPLARHRLLLQSMRSFWGERAASTMRGGSRGFG